MDSASAEPAAVDDDGEPTTSDDPAAGPSVVRARARLPLLFSVAGVVLAVDQLTKWWAVEKLGHGQIIDLVWTARFNLIRNDGAAFGVGRSITPLIAVTAMGVGIAIVVAARRIDQRMMLVALGLVLGGAVGNVIDRFVRVGDGFLRGRVVDFIDFQWWPVFNVADIGVVVGGALLVLLLSRHHDGDTGDHAPGCSRDDHPADTSVR